MLSLSYFITDENGLLGFIQGDSFARDAEPSVICCLIQFRQNSASLSFSHDSDSPSKTRFWQSAFIQSTKMNYAAMTA